MEPSNLYDYISIETTADMAPLQTVSKITVRNQCNLLKLLLDAAVMGYVAGKQRCS